MYRAVTLYSMRNGYILNGIPDDKRITGALDRINIEFLYNPVSGEFETHLNSENVEREIRSIDVSSYVSPVSTIPQVRTKLVALQRQIGLSKGIVMDGRDIGTVVFPEAELKIFMTASVDIRAKRRYDELTGKGIVVDFEDVRQNIIARDITDENRDISPLRRADDAIILDNSRMTVEQQMEWVRGIIEKKINES
jgi:cytidylate kinase